MSLEVERLVKSFAGREVLRGVDARLPSGEIFSIVGPSGAGKTTFLRCVGFLARSDGGSVRYDGAEAPADPVTLLALRRRIGMVAQNPFLFRGSAAYNVSFGLCVRDSPIGRRKASRPSASGAAATQRRPGSRREKPSGSPSHGRSSCGPTSSCSTSSPRTSIPRT